MNIISPQAAFSPHNPWTDANVELLKQCWADGLSASQTAVLIGGVTRSAVCGKIHRLGLTGRAKVPSASSGRRKRRRKPANLSSGANAPFNATAREPLPDELPASVIPIGQRRTLLELTDATCRFPYGEVGTEGFFFCGGVTGFESSYCAFHHDVCWTRPRPTTPVAESERRRRRAHKSNVARATA